MKITCQGYLETYLGGEETYSMLVQPDQCRAKVRCYLLVLYTDCPTLAVGRG